MRASLSESHSSARCSSAKLVSVNLLRPAGYGQTDDAGHGPSHALTTSKVSGDFGAIRMRMSCTPGTIVTEPEMNAEERYTESASPVLAPGVPLSEVTVPIVQTEDNKFPTASNWLTFTPMLPSHGAAHCAAPRSARPGGALRPDPRLGH